jgi:two-component system CheB/CheR fusion protein
VRKEIREMVIFAPQNLIMDPPFTKLDILSCRNLLIYLTTEVQKKLIPLFHYSLTPGGILFQGSAETVGDFTHLFSPLNAKSRLFRRTESVLRPEQIVFPSAFTAGPAVISEARTATNPPASLQALADQLVLQSYAPPAVLTMTRAIFFTSVAGPVNTWNPPQARPTGIFLLWPVKDCVMNWRTPSRKRCVKKKA